MTTQTILTFATALVIGFAFGRIYIYNQLKKTLILDTASDTPIGDSLARELNIMLDQINPGDRA